MQAQLVEVWPVGRLLRQVVLDLELLEVPVQAEKEVETAVDLAARALIQMVEKARNLAKAEQEVKLEARELAEPQE
jgi:hypothetical protein